MPFSNEASNKPISLVVAKVSMAGDVLGDLVLNGLGQHIPSPFPQNLGQNIPAAG